MHIVHRQVTNNNNKNYQPVNIHVDFFLKLNYYILKTNRLQWERTPLVRFKRKQKQSPDKLSTALPVAECRKELQEDWTQTKNRKRARVGRERSLCLKRPPRRSLHLAYALCSPSFLLKRVFCVEIRCCEKTTTTTTEKL